ncbi:MAG: hypothetical protein HN348_07260 [Proteobacteria bacterium]|nr:hypothetical protein [Pseudomonadota bacterium]
MILLLALSLAQAEVLLSDNECAAQVVMTMPPLSPHSPVESGGYIIYPSLIGDDDSIRSTIKKLKENSSIEPFVAVDLEGGHFNAFGPSPKHPSAADQHDVDGARAAGEAAGARLSALGFNVNFAPSLDMAAEGNMARQYRSYGTDPVDVAQKAEAFAKGLHQHGVLAVGKHYPGYGALSGNTDVETVTAPWTKEELEHHQLPFVLVGEELDGVLFSSINYPAIGPGPAHSIPALVDEAHESGWLTFTDDLVISARVADIPLREAVVAALAAGLDILVISAPPDWGDHDGAQMVLEAMAKDSAIKSQVRRACERVLQSKVKLKKEQ